MPSSVVLSTNGPSHHVQSWKSIGIGATRGDAGSQGILAKTNALLIRLGATSFRTRRTKRTSYTRAWQGNATGRSARFPCTPRIGKHAGSPVMSRSAIKRQRNSSATVSTPKINRTFNTQQASALAISTFTRRSFLTFRTMH